MDKKKLAAALQEQIWVETCDTIPAARELAARGLGKVAVELAAADKFRKTTPTRTLTNRAARRATKKGKK